jgi:ribosomal protein S18 acetylase RimI-like enzyme
VVKGLEEGMALVVEVEGRPAAALVALPRPQFGTFELVDLRVDYDYRRQGFATALMYQFLGALRDRQDVRAVYAEVRANNTPAQELLARLGFELSGFDERRRSNHDLVKEAATLLWYLEMAE